MSAFVVMFGSRPQAVASSLEAARAETVRREEVKQQGLELRWDEHPRGWRLMSRQSDKRRFAWTNRWVAEAVEVEA